MAKKGDIEKLAESAGVPVEELERVVEESEDGDARTADNKKRVQEAEKLVKAATKEETAAAMRLHEMTYGEGLGDWLESPVTHRAAMIQQARYVLTGEKPDLPQT